MAQREDILEMLTELPTGLAQVGVTLGTGLAGDIAGGLRGAFDIARGRSLNDAVSAIQETQDAVTIMPPEDSYGEALLEEVGNLIQKPLPVVGKSIPEIAQSSYDVAYDVGGPVGATAFQTLLEGGAEALLPFKGGRAVGRVADDIATAPRDSSVMDAIAQASLLRDPSTQTLIVDDRDVPVIDDTPSVEVEAPDAIADEATGRTFDIDRDVKRAQRRASISRDEKSIIENAGFTPEQTKREIEAFKNYRATHAVSDGWQPISLRIKRDAETGKNKVIYTTKTSSFHIDKKTGRPYTDTKDSRARTNAVNRLSKKLVGDFRKVESRAKDGDKNAITILDGVNWYKGAKQKIFDAFGGAANIYGDLNAALSPNTNLADNVKFANSAAARFLRGEFDENLQALQKHLEAGGGRQDFPEELLIRQPNGKKYGLNSYNAMLAMIDSFRGLPPGSAPKMRNYGASLLGLSTDPVIDIWAGRTAQRLAGRPRVAPVNDTASRIGGTVSAKGDKVTGAYGFAQDVFRKAAEELNLDPNDLQAVMWLFEKELWERNKWTGQREGNILELLDDLGGQGQPQRFQAGISVTQQSVPTPEVQQAGREGLLNSLNSNPQVLAARAVDSEGLYYGDFEKSYDMEWTAGADFDPSVAVSDVAKVAKDNNQIDAFVARVITGNEVNPNARPGIEIYFKEGKSKEQTAQIAKIVSDMGQDGFTFISDAKLRDGPTEFTGIRLVYTPEISARYADEATRDAMLDPNKLDEMFKKAEDEMHDIVDVVSKNDDILFAKRYNYDAIVMGKENYNDYIIDTPETNRRITTGPSKVSFGQSRYQHVRRAIERYRQSQDTGSVPVGSASDVSGSQVLDDITNLNLPDLDQ